MATSFNINQRVQGPFGDIFSVNTGATDRLSQQLYAEDKQREAQHAAENKRLDDEFAKNLSNVRDIDIAPITEAYGTWKEANKQAIKQKSITPQQQLELLKKKAEMYKLIQGSKDIKAKEQEVRKMGDKPNPNLQDDWQQQLGTSLVTPIGKNNFLNYNHIYDGADYKDATKDMAAWMGKPQKGVLGKPVVDAAGLQTKTPVFDFPSDKTGDQVLASALLGMTKTRDAAKYWTLQATKVPDEQYLNTDAQYKQLPQDKWDLLGKPKPVLDISKATTPLEKYGIHMAQIHELTNIPTQSGFKTETNLSAKMDRQDKLKLLMQQRGFAHAENMVGLRERIHKLYKDASDQEKINDAQGFIDEVEKQGEVVPNDTLMRITDADGKTIAEGFTLPKGSIKLKVGPVITHAFEFTDEKGKKNPPTVIYKLPTGNYKLLGDGINREITPQEFKAGIVDNVFNTATKLNQIHTNKVVPNSGKKSTKIKITW